MLHTLSPPAPVVVPATPLGVIYGEVQRQVAMLAVNDCFWLMTVTMTILTLGIFLLRRPRHAPVPTAAH